MGPLLASAFHNTAAFSNAQAPARFVAASGSLRSYVSGFQYLEHGQNGRTRHDQYLEVDTARQLLPHRAEFTPQFTAHGFQLIPSQIGASAVAAAAAADSDNVLVPLYADSVKRKRRLKMKRHKYKKRMRAMKAGNK